VKPEVTAFTHKEFPMTDKEFYWLQAYAKQQTGIHLSEHKRDMLYSRLARRIRELNLDSFKAYCEYLESNESSEITPFTNAITTNLTHFYREQHHFDFMRDNFIPALKASNAKRLRFWSCASSTGQEPYSLAMTLADYFYGDKWARHTSGLGVDFDLKILATDLDTNVLDHARLGIYSPEVMKPVPKNNQQKHFTKLSSGEFQIKESIKKMVTYKQLNLLHNWPMKGPFDLIFCRNVIIYFDKETQLKLFEKMAKMIRPGGYLILGHSESLFQMNHAFKLIGKTIYQRLD
jgi:chemotaxis protein methyltransferase CheR